ncbi:MAG: 50S ribosomal protein L23 [Candidatus Liptonbacteria bacterium]
MNTSLIKKIVVTERSVSLNEQGKYVFIVEPHATKNEVKKAVHNLYHVDVVAVNMISLPGKTRRYRGLKRARPGYKKAIASLKNGQKIDIGR